MPVKSPLLWTLLITTEYVTFYRMGNTLQSKLTSNGNCVNAQPGIFLQALIEGPTTGVKRQALSFKRMSLTSLVIEIPRTIGTAALIKAIKKQELNAKWTKTSWAQKLAQRQRRANLTDFERFQVHVCKKKLALKKQAALKGIKA
jgi:large subunit ribosomal protein L14e